MTRRRANTPTTTQYVWCRSSGRVVRWAHQVLAMLWCAAICYDAATTSSISINRGVTFASRLLSTKERSVFVIQCPVCGAQNVPQSRFCTVCGTALAAAPATSTSAAPARADARAQTLAPPAPPVSTTNGAASAPVPITNGVSAMSNQTQPLSPDMTAAS